MDSDPPAADSFAASALPISLGDVAADLRLDAHEAGPATVAPHAALATGSLARVIWRFGLPAVASNLLMTLFGTFDAYWVGTRVGSAGLAAVSTSVFWIWMAISVAEMMSIGLTAVAARRHGEGSPASAAHAVGQALMLSVGLGALAALVGLLTLDTMFAIMRTPPEVTELGRRYLRAYLLGAPLIFGFFAVDAAFRASGDTRTPFLLLVTSVTATLILDPLLILGVGPFPELGVTGAALATVATRGSAFVTGLVILRRRGMIRVSGVDGAVLRAVARVGAPTALTGVLFSVIYIALTRVTTQFGTPALGALGVGHRVESWLYMTGMGFGAAAAAVVGQNIGAGRLDRAERAGWITVSYASVPGIVMCALQLLWPEALASVFSNDPALVAEAASYLRIVAVAQLVLTAEIVLEGALGGAGDTVPPMITSTLLTALRIPLAAWAAARWGTSGIWWVISLTAIARGVAMMVLWRAGRWRRTSL